MTILDALLVRISRRSTLGFMPQRPPHPCSVPDCPALVSRGARCPDHVRAQRREADSLRPSGSRRYPHAWSKPGGYREQHLHREPSCRFCRAGTQLEVDHIDGDSTNHNPSNLRTLCHSCHSGRTARDQGFARRTTRAVR